MNSNPEHRFVSTAQVARALGVSVTTVKRWVDGGVLPAHKTVGGHRKLMMADVLRLTRAGTLPPADIGCLLPHAAAAAGGALEDVRQQLTLALHTADADMVRGLLHETYRRGAAIHDLADAVISPAMADVGHAWADGRLSVMQEHRATQAMVAAMYELRALLRKPADAPRPLAVGGAPEHDPYILPSLTVKLVLLDAGWDAVNLGPHTPGGALRTALAELKPRLLWVSVTHVVDDGAFLRDYLATYEAAATAGVAVVIGGSGLHDDLRAKMPHTFFGRRMADVAAYAKSLHKRPGIPKRGRPKLTADGD